ncbi:MAG TPA: GGDEF domain-containing protein [Steroidobacteraceae bacterium]|jgi:diguanylate cyclase (GGDEF)-like protein|nr:GGDEF domain-containing protein [Steroidobacteraceae bacterium]
MFGSPAFAHPLGSPETTPGRNASITEELNAAAMDGDAQRVKRLLAQLLHGPNRRMDEHIHQQVAAIEELFYAMRTVAITDDLTEVYNRRGFDWAASRLLRHLTRERRGALLLYVDVDNLKIVNDTLGHAAGDHLLKACAWALRSACGDGAVIGRIGGDEFALLTRLNPTESHSLLRKRIHDAIQDCNATGQCPLSMSIGAAEFDALRPASVRALLERADQAMYLEKFRSVAAPAEPPELTDSAAELLVAAGEPA